MSTRSPAEVEEIRQHIARLKQQDWLGQARQWWPDYLFHCTDVRNVANILRSGEMLSRTQALTLQQLRVDIASEEIIAQTEEAWKDYVRLYFRPRTPTHSNRGISPLQPPTLRRTMSYPSILAHTRYGSVDEAWSPVHRWQCCSWGCAN